MTRWALLPLALGVPLLGAVLLAATQSWARRLSGGLVALAAAGATAGICGLILARVVSRGQLVYWFGGWTPRGGVALGVDFAVDPIGAGLATYVAVLAVVALIFSLRHFDVVGHAYPTLMLIFLAAMVGFSLSGDLFNLFVFFELMTVTAIALTAHRADQRAPLEGAMNFALVISVAGFLILTGIGILYSRTGALNLAQIGVALSGHRADAAVLVAFGLIATGFLVKAAIVPFHFWLADAYASAPTPVCILFAGAMSELGLYAVARLYWTMFAGPLAPHLPQLRAILVVAGCLTALLGAVMCVVQRHLKRLLAFATVSYMGLFLVGVGLLRADALAGTAVFVIADGLAKASLFVCVGILQYRCGGEVTVSALHGRGRALPYTGVVYALGALSLAALPFCGSFVGKSLIEDAAGHAPGYGWVAPLFTLTSIICAGAVMRAGARVFLGWGAAVEAPGVDAGGPSAGEEEGHARTPLLLFAPAVSLAVAGLVVGIVPGLADAAGAAAMRFVDRGAYVSGVLGAHVTPLPAASVSAASTVDYVYGALSVLGSIALALATRRPWRWVRGRWPAVPLRALRALHSGRPGDYVVWLTAGCATLVALFSVALR